MGAKAFLSIAGLVGTLTSTIIVSPSNSRKVKAAGEYVIHNWSAEVDEINVEVDCTGQIILGGGQFDYNKKATLRWTAKIEESDYENLIDLKEVKVTSVVELSSRENGEKLWTIVDRSRDVEIKLNNDSSKNELKVTLSDKWKNGQQVVVSGFSDFGSFNCQLPITMKGGVAQQQQSYEASLEQLQTGEYEFIRTKDPVEIKVSLAQCSWSEDKKQFECNLKITYGGNLDWSQKVTAKARIRFE